MSETNDKNDEEITREQAAKEIERYCERCGDVISDDERVLLDEVAYMVREGIYADE